MNIVSRSILQLSILIVFLVLLSGGSAVYWFYALHMEDRKVGLNNLVNTSVNLIESVSIFDKNQSADFPGGSGEATLSQIMSSRAEGFFRFGQTGETLFAQLQGEHIQILQLRDPSTPITLSLDTHFAEPIRRALKGEEGIMEGLDYRGTMVLAAYRYIPSLNLGIVVKEDMAEIRAPFVTGALLLMGTASILSLFGVIVFLRWNQPLIHSLEEEKERFELILNAAGEGIYGVDSEGAVIFINSSGAELLGGDVKDIIGKQQDDFICSDKTHKGLIGSVAEDEETPKISDDFFCKLNGDSFPVEHTSRPILKMGKASGTVVTFSDVSKRLELWKKYDEKTAYLESILLGAADGVISIDENGLIEIFNKSAEEMFGYDDCEVVGKNINILMPEPYKNNHDMYLKRYLDMPSRVSLNLTREVVGQRQNGDTFPMELTIIEVSFSGKRKFVGTVRDMTDQRARAEELKILARAVEQSPNTVLITDPSGNIEYVNKKFIETSGYTLDEVRGKNPRILKGGQTPYGRYKRLWSNITSGQEWRGEFLNRKKNGELYWEFTAISPIFDENGSIKHFLALKEDITDRKRAQKTLEEYARTLELRVETRTNDLNSALAISEESRTRMETIVSSVPAGVIVTDHEGTVILMNSRAEKVFGDSRGQPFDRILNDFSENIAPRSEIGRATLGEGEMFDFDVNAPNTKIMRATSSAIKNSSGVGMGFVTIMVDVTHEREMDRMKTEFLSTAAHELRTPLTTIQGFSEILLTKSRLSVEEKDRYLNFIHGEAVHLADIVNDLLDISRIESKIGFSLKCGICDMRDIVKKNVELLREALDSGEFVLDSAIPSSFCYVDENKMSQVLLNIYSNAIKYSPRGGKISTTLRNLNDFLEVTIQDQGTGMSQAQVEQIFDKFYRADPNGSIQGTGLGMSIVKLIVEAHGGCVSVQSQLGKGTTVRFTVPK